LKRFYEEEHRKAFAAECSLTHTF
jgi:hypothetical protein